MVFHSIENFQVQNYKDKNDKNWQLDNLELLCYNCYFLNVGDVFTNKQIKSIEDDYTPTETSKPDFQVDDSWLNDENLSYFKDLLSDGDEDIDPTDENNYISFND